MNGVSSRIRVLAVDDHPLVREGIGGLVRVRPDMALVAEAANGRDAIQQFRTHRPDVTLMDLQMPEMNGLDALIAIRAEFPDAKVIVLTTYEGDVHILRAVKAGALGYLLKNTPAEVAVLRLIAEGNANKQIADLLHVTEDTVKGRVKSIRFETRRQRPDARGDHRPEEGSHRARFHQLERGISTPTAVAVVTGFELWLFAMRSGAWTAALLAAIALAVKLIGPGAWSVDARWFGWRRIRRPRNRRPDPQSSAEGQMLNRNSTALLGALLCAPLMFVASPARSQSFYGSLVSVVRDAQGAVIPTATIVLTNTATSERREGVSAEDGEYRFVNLVPGTYRLEVEASGFQRYVRDPIEINVQSQPRIEVALQLGSLAETVQVSGAAPVLQTENASVGIVVTSRSVQELPLNGRNVLNLIALAPAVVPQGGSEGSLTGKNVFAGGNFQIGGGTANQSASYFDGVPVQDSAYGNIVVLTPSPESVAEFRVQTNNSSAEFGRFTGGVINIASRSGTNVLRGSLFEFRCAAANSGCQERRGGAEVRVRSERRGNAGRVLSRRG